MSIVAVDVGNSTISPVCLFTTLSFASIFLKYSCTCSTLTNYQPASKSASSSIGYMQPHSHPFWSLERGLRIRLTSMRYIPSHTCANHSYNGCSVNSPFLFSTKTFARSELCNVYAKIWGSSIHHLARMSFDFRYKLQPVAIVV